MTRIEPLGFIAPPSPSTGIWKLRTWSVSHYREMQDAREVVTRAAFRSDTVFLAAWTHQRPYADSPRPEHWLPVHCTPPYGTNRLREGDEPGGFITSRNDIVRRVKILLPWFFWQYTSVYAHGYVTLCSQASHQDAAFAWWPA